MKRAAADEHAAEARVFILRQGVPNLGAKMVALGRIEMTLCKIRPLLAGFKIYIHARAPKTRTLRPRL